MKSNSLWILSAAIKGIFLFLTDFSGSASVRVVCILTVYAFGHYPATHGFLLKLIEAWGLLQGDQGILQTVVVSLSYPT
ncbi:MAG: hypothetical protein GY880_23750 [Planctomycetaceae bacterium]|nr:hypothetical protein [Planctomycetaceae bacterium]